MGTSVRAFRLAFCGACERLSRGAATGHGALPRRMEDPSAAGPRFCQSGDVKL